MNCSNQSNHVSAFPAYDRERCPVCRKTYVRKIKDEQFQELAQKLFNEAGYPGNVYKTNPIRLRYFENKALGIIEEE